MVHRVVVALVVMMAELDKGIVVEFLQVEAYTHQLKVEEAVKYHKLLVVAVVVAEVDMMVVSCIHLIVVVVEEIVVTMVA